MPQLFYLAEDNDNLAKLIKNLGTKIFVIDKIYFHNRTNDKVEIKQKGTSLIVRIENFATCRGDTTVTDFYAKCFQLENMRCYRNTFYGEYIEYDLDIFTDKTRIGLSIIEYPGLPEYIAITTETSELADLVANSYGLQNSIKSLYDVYTEDYGIEPDYEKGWSISFDNFLVSNDNLIKNNRDKLIEILDHQNIKHKEYIVDLEKKYKEYISVQIAK
jgi:hypothetical protein